MVIEKYMKYKLLAVSTEYEVNIGDYIQALASSQFLPHIDGFIQREELKDYNGENCAVIMNGWYMHNTEQWPPSSKIYPLYIAVHFNSSAKDILFSEESVKYLHKFEPIGCRDLYTKELLCKNGIDAYYSSCMTLTLGYKYKTNEKDDTYYFVDPYFVTQWNLYSIIYNFFYLIFNWKPINIISKKYPENKTGFRKKMILTSFYREYKKIFSKEILLNAEYICQQDKYYKNHFKSDEERLIEAERLVKKYARAKLVVTSRIHCALPCLGLETPVIYTDNTAQSEMSSCRLGGLKELFNIVQWNKGKLQANFELKGKIDNKNLPVNSTNWKVLATNLINTCKAFIERTK